MSSRAFCAAQRRFIPPSKWPAWFRAAIPLTRRYANAWRVLADYPDEIQMRARVGPNAGEWLWVRASGPGDPLMERAKGGDETFARFFSHAIAAACRSKIRPARETIEAFKRGEQWAIDEIRPARTST